MTNISHSFCCSYYRNVFKFINAHFPLLLTLAKLAISLSVPAMQHGHVAFRRLKRRQSRWRQGRYDVLKSVELVDRRRFELDFFGGTWEIVIVSSFDQGLNSRQPNCWGQISDLQECCYTIAWSGNQGTQSHLCVLLSCLNQMQQYVARFWWQRCYS